jgi:hypothetical protein
MSNKYPIFVEKGAWSLVASKLDPVRHEIIGHPAFFLAPKNQACLQLLF